MYKIMIIFLLIFPTMGLLGARRRRDNPNRSWLPKRERDILDIRFPGIPRVYAPPRTTQPDGNSCGIFAAAYATTIMFGMDPETYSLLLRPIHEPQNNRSMFLRNHMAMCLEQDQIILFPSDEN